MHVCRTYYKSKLKASKFKLMNGEQSRAATSASCFTSHHHLRVVVNRELKLERDGDIVILMGSKLKMLASIWVLLVGGSQTHKYGVVKVARNCPTRHYNDIIRMECTSGDRAFACRTKFRFVQYTYSTVQYMYE
jgi:hypothetical protein